MGGRGGSSGAGKARGGGGGQTQSQPQQTLLQSNAPGGYDNYGNQALIKYQNQDDDKTARFLAKVHRDTDLNQIQKQTNDPYGFYDNDFQRLVLQLGLNDKPQVMSAREFNAYVKRTGAEVLYRGVSGQDVITRFNDSPNNHVGNGVYGDGNYFAPDKAIATRYARTAARTSGKGGSGAVMTAALSPNARVVDYNTVEREISRHNARLRASLKHAGSAGTRTYSSNIGISQMALKMGYNVVRKPGFADIVLTRDAVVVKKGR